MMMIREKLQAGDIFLTTNPSSFFSRAILFFSRSPGEEPTNASHVGLVVRGFPGDARIVEAVGRVRVGFLSRYADKKTRVAIYRPRNISFADLDAIVRSALEDVGRGYGWLKLLPHVGDWLLGGRYVFRRLARLDRFPICSFHVASKFQKIGKDFGVPVGAATPDDIDDFCRSHPDKYEMIRDFAPL